MKRFRLRAHDDPYADLLLGSPSPALPHKGGGSRVGVGPRQHALIHTALVNANTGSVHSAKLCITELARLKRTTEANGKC